MKKSVVGLVVVLLLAAGSLFADLSGNSYSGTDGSKIEFVNSFIGRLVTGNTSQYFEYRHENGYCLVSWPDGRKAFWRFDEKSGRLAMTAAPFKTWSPLLKRDAVLVAEAAREAVVVMLAYVDGAGKLVERYKKARSADDVQLVDNESQQMAMTMGTRMGELQKKYEHVDGTKLQANASVSNASAALSKASQDLAAAQQAAIDATKGQ